MSEDTVFKPNEKELKLFEQEKVELYKGTFVVCLTYGLSALLLLVAVLFTTWGKEYIYDKFAPAVITYILGSIIIILYLLSSIYTIKPRRIGEEVDSNTLCPDFWKLEKVPSNMKSEIISNNNIVDQHIIPEVNTEKSKNIQYRCVSDNNVYGNVSDNLKMKQSLSTNNNYEAGFNTKDKALQYASANKVSILPPQYIVNIPTKNSDTNIYKDLQKYAKFSGAYSANNSNLFDITNSNVLRVGDSQYIGQDSNIRAILNNYESKTPLICNVVYPQVLGILDNRTQEGNGISCEYAKQCGVSWSSLNCNK